MKNPMHQEILTFYKLDKVKNENQKRAIRKNVINLFRKKYKSRKWDELTKTEKQEFKLITVKNYMLDKIRYPDNDRKLKPTPTAEEKVKKIEDTIEKELNELHKPLVFIDEHNKKIEILYKNFYNPSASIEENRTSFMKFCEYHYQFFGHKLELSFEEWTRNPLRLCDLSKEYEYPFDDGNQDDEQDEPVTDIEILEEMIACLMKELNINIDVNEIVRCKKTIKNAQHLNYEEMDANPKNISIAASKLKLLNHDFIIKKGG